MSGHTPGPWRIGSTQTRVESRAGSVLAVTDYEPHIPEVAARANARLIAAAPELLEALKAVEDSICLLGLHTDEDDCEGCRLRQRSRAAIAKAEGR